MLYFSILYKEKNHHFTLQSFQTRYSIKNKKEPFVRKALLKTLYIVINRKHYKL